MSFLITLGTYIMFFNLFIYVGFTFASFVLLGIIGYQKYNGEKTKKKMNSRVVVNQYVTLTGIPTWKRINGRLVKKFYIVDIEHDDFGFRPEKKELDKVKMRLFSIWNRKNGRLVRSESY